MFPTSHHREERRRSCGYRNAREGSPHRFDFINEQSVGDTNPVSESKDVLELLDGVDYTNTVDVCFASVRETHQFLVEGGSNTSAIQLSDFLQMREPSIKSML